MKIIKYDSINEATQLFHYFKQGRLNVLKLGHKLKSCYLIQLCLIPTV